MQNTSDFNFLALRSMLMASDKTKKNDDTSTTHGNSSICEFGDKPRVVDTPKAFIAKRRRCTKTVTKCPHTDAKHYAKVNPLII